MPEGYRLLKVFNHNVVLAETREKKEKILVGKGIGFGRISGDVLPGDAVIDKTFSLDDPVNSDRFRQLLLVVDDAVIGVCQDMIHMIGRELDEELDEKVHISLTDHIAFTLKRLKNGDLIANPFLAEIEILYKRELEVARKAVRLLESATGIAIPDGEAGFIAMHVASARNKGNLSATLKNAALTGIITELIERELQVVIAKESLDYARFVTHIRFVLERIRNNSPIHNELLGTIRRKYKNSYAIAQKAGKRLGQELGTEIAEAEIGFIALYIEKLRRHS